MLPSRVVDYDYRMLNTFDNIVAVPGGVHNYQELNLPLAPIGRGNVDMDLTPEEFPNRRRRPRPDEEFEPFGQVGPILPLMERRQRRRYMKSSYRAYSMFPRFVRLKYFF